MSAWYTIVNLLIEAWYTWIEPFFRVAVEWIFGSIWWALSGVLDWIVGYIPGLNLDSNYSLSANLAGYIPAAKALLNPFVVWTPLLAGLASYLFSVAFAIVMRGIIFAIRWVWGSN